jgi:hypothetical protein
MITCSVLRCQNPGSGFVTGGRKRRDFHEAYVCAEHKARIDSGSHWDIQDTHVLMDQDLAPALERWSGRDSMGTPGYTLSFEAPGQDKPFEVFLTPADVKYLRKHFSSRVE